MLGRYTLRYRNLSEIRPLRFLVATGVFAVVAASALPASAQVTVIASNGNLFQTSGLSAVATTGSDMDGMLVTANFVNGTSETRAWADISSGVGGVSGTGWLLQASGNTIGAGAWVLGSTNAIGISSIVLNGAPGRTIFDRTFGNAIGTPGSSNGRDFDVTFGLANFAITAEYTNILRLNQDPPVGDLYTTLRITFTSPAGGFARQSPTQGRFLRFTQDTDNAAVGAPINPVPTGAPEPGTLALLAIGAVGFGGFAMRRKKA
jgi:hypothetical protein